MAIAVVDNEGLLQYFARMENRFACKHGDRRLQGLYGGSSCACRHAKWDKWLFRAILFTGFNIPMPERSCSSAVAFPSGCEGRVVGGIGISGGTVEEDEQVASAVLDTLAVNGMSGGIDQAPSSGKPKGANWMSYVGREVWSRLFSKKVVLSPMNLFPFLPGLLSSLLMTIS